MTGKNCLIFNGFPEPVSKEIGENKLQHIQPLLPER